MVFFFVRKLLNNYGEIPALELQLEADWGQAITEELEEQAKEYSALIPEEALLSRSYATVFGDLFKEELALEERLDAFDRSAHQTSNSGEGPEGNIGPDRGRSKRSNTGKARAND